MSRSHASRFAPTLLVASALFVGFSSCSSMGSHRPNTVAAASAEQRASMLDQVKSLEGTWETADPSGAKAVASVFNVSSDGSVVREIMFPGTAQEMTNMYHMDGPSLMCTHYCSMGNQPHMRATSAQKGKLHFALDSITNFTSDDSEYMGDLVLEWIDKNHLRCHWTAFRFGKTTSQSEFDLVRKV